MNFREYSAAFHAQNDDILHFGILGMKWGVRRYQNEDGSLTAAGKKRYYKDEVRKSNNQIDEAKRGISSYELSKTDYIKDAIKDIKVLDPRTGYVSDSYTDKDIDTLAKKLTSNKLGMYVQGEKELTKEALYEALKTKYNEQKQKWNTEQHEEAKRVEKAKGIFDSDGKDLFTENDTMKDPKRAKAAADLGLEALNKIGRQGYDPKEGITDGDRDWFIWEDQTIGMATIADLALHGKNKQDIKDLIRAAETLYVSGDENYNHKHGVFQLAESYVGDDYIDALFAILNAKGYLNHSAIKRKNIKMKVKSIKNEKKKIKGC